jgi:hypothetical protein
VIAQKTSTEARSTTENAKPCIIASNYAPRGPHSGQLSRDHSGADLLEVQQHLDEGGAVITLDPALVHTSIGYP